MAPELAPLPSIIDSRQFIEDKKESDIEDPPSKEMTADDNYDDEAEDSLSDADEDSSTGCSTVGPATVSGAENGDDDDTDKSYRIFLSKLLVMVVLAVSATTISVVAYKHHTRQQSQELKRQFISQAADIIKASASTLSSTVSALNTFSHTVTSLAMVGGDDWPLVDLPNFGIGAHDFIASTGSKFVAMSPVVADQDRSTWEDFTVNLLNATSFPTLWKNGYRGDGPVNDFSSGPYLPIWQTYPPSPAYNLVNFNLMSIPPFKELAHVVLDTHKPLLSAVLEDDEEVLEDILGKNATTEATPMSLLMQPVYRDFRTIDDIDKKEHTSHLVALLWVVLPWHAILKDALLDLEYSVIAVLKSQCQHQDDQAFTFHKSVDRDQVDFLGVGDLHDDDDNALETSSVLNMTDTLEDFCTYSLHVYPSQEDPFSGGKGMPASIAVTVVLVFLFTALVFLAYDTLVQRRNRKFEQAAKQTSKIIHNLFPQQVHDRLFRNDDSIRSQRAILPKRNSNNGGNKVRRYQTPKINMLHFLSDDEESKTSIGGERKRPKSKPIADLFPEATVMFCDIAGFTAWSSVREPAQVFVLLETVYNAFDCIAKRRKVFKVETIGDSYLAVAGVPSPRKDHGVVCVRFAHDCMTEFDSLVLDLSTELGPDTAELAMRFGCHSGPITAGVLRGERTRFQLFGDTVNVASRMESTGQRGKIQVSEATATLLRDARKSHWLTQRPEPIHAKGKGEMITYWVNPKASAQASFSTRSLFHVPTTKDILPPPNLARATTTSMVDTFLSMNDKSQRGLRCDLDQVRHGESLNNMEENADQEQIDPKLQRNISWISGVLLSLLRQIVARRLAMGKRTVGQTQATRQARMAMTPEPGKLVLDEMEEIISLPKFDAKATRRFVDPDCVELPSEVEEQLRSFVTVVALMYQDNPFHSFFHATHVTMSVSKLLSRIVAPEDLDGDDLSKNSKRRAFESKLHDHTYGITSDPLTQFAVVFSAMIHDVDHPGVPNSVLVKNGTPIAEHYRNKSVAEQNSLDVAWELLMDDAYADLCACIFTNEPELHRFRQLVVNVVLATDICDAEMNSLRKTRWDKAFNTRASVVAAPKPGRAEFVSVVDDNNRKATIIIEHLIQASDVAHTMQHWEVYINWNEKLFEEMYAAYWSGHLDKDPALSWYEGELGFYDYYIIPLAKKLKECGVFGVSSDEYLCYALENRREWEHKGKRIVEEYVKKYMPAQDKAAGLPEVGGLRMVAEAGSVGDLEQYPSEEDDSEDEEQYPSGDDDFVGGVEQHSLEKDDCVAVDLYQMEEDGNQFETKMGACRDMLLPLDPFDMTESASNRSSTSRAVDGEQLDMKMGACRDMPMLSLADSYDLADSASNCSSNADQLFGVREHQYGGVTTPSA